MTIYLYKSKPLTYENARDISIKIWKLRSEGNDDEAKEYISSKQVEHHITFTNGCPLCNLFMRMVIESCQSGPISVKNICSDLCPLVWKDPKEERFSKYRENHSLPCSRNYWHFHFWNSVGSTERSKHWAKKLYKELLATPEEKPKPVVNGPKPHIMIIDEALTIDNKIHDITR